MEETTMMNEETKTVENTNLDVPEEVSTEVKSGGKLGLVAVGVSAVAAAGAGLYFGVKKLVKRHDEKVIKRFLEDNPDVEVVYEDEETFDLEVEEPEKESEKSK